MKKKLTFLVLGFVALSSFVCVGLYMFAIWQQRIPTKLHPLIAHGPCWQSVCSEQDSIERMYQVLNLPYDYKSGSQPTLWSENNDYYVYDWHLGGGLDDLDSMFWLDTLVYKQNGIIKKIFIRPDGTHNASALVNRFGYPDEYYSEVTRYEAKFCEIILHYVAEEMWIHLWSTNITLYGEFETHMDTDILYTPGLLLAEDLEFFQSTMKNFSLEKMQPIMPAQMDDLNKINNCLQ